MGNSWRIGVRDGEHTDLVDQGPFRWVRNPIFSFLILTAAALAVLVPNRLSVVAFFCLSLAVELQVRFVEEPYLSRTHGDRYAAYCQRVGRFVPWIGRARRRRSGS
jgi:protein-S-isoprenylcysteine O-methyltransferase Ste14